MEKCAPRGSKKEKEVRDATLVQQIPSVSTFLTNKQVEGDDGLNVSSGRSAATCEQPG